MQRRKSQRYVNINIVDIIASSFRAISLNIACHYLGRGLRGIVTWSGIKFNKSRNCISFAHRKTNSVGTRIKIETWLLAEVLTKLCTGPLAIWKSGYLGWALVNRMNVCFCNLWKWKINTIYICPTSWPLGCRPLWRWRCGRGWRGRRGTRPAPPWPPAATSQCRTLEQNEIK